MRIRFKEDDTLVITADGSVEAMALKYWMNEYKVHGDKLLEVETDAPVHELSSTNAD